MLLQFRHLGTGMYPLSTAIRKTAISCTVSTTYHYAVLKWLLLCSNEYLCFQKTTKLEYMFPDGFPDHAKNIVNEILVSTCMYNSCKLRIDTINFF